MAEASSSGGKASEEEDDSDEASLSHGAANPRSPRHTNKRKKLRYVRDYLQRLPKHQRKRIQKEIDKGYKPALTVDNITSALNGIDWGKIGRGILNLPDSKYDEITKQFSSADDRVRAGVREWLLRDPFTSWRRLTDQLYYWYKEEQADSILHYAEELTDTTLTHRNLSTVLNHVVNMDRLMDCLDIPRSVQKKISEHSKDKEQQREECIYYWMNISPYSLIGWGVLGGLLHYYGEEAALRAANEYIQRAPEPTLTVDNLTPVLKSVQGKDMDSVLLYLHIPYSKQEQLQQQYSRRQVKTAHAGYIIGHHPSPCWTIVANALWSWKVAGALEMVQTSYLKGTSESRRLFQQSMKKGHVDMYNDKMLLYGSAGVGKTCTMKIVAGEKPPVVRNSTPVATKPMTMYQLQTIKGKRRKYISPDRMKLCARISKATQGREIIKALTESRKLATEKTHSMDSNGDEAVPPNPKRPRLEAAKQVHEKPVSSRGDSITGRGKSPYNPTAEVCEGPPAPAELTLQDVAAQAGLKTLDVLDQECSQQVLLRLAKHCVDWQLTGFHLELTKAEITAVNGDYGSIDEKRIGMLGRWKEKFAFKATYRVFIEALLSCGKASDAIDGCRAIVSSVKVLAEDEKGNLKFSSTMSDDDFFKWLRSKGISEKDCNTLFENGITASGFSRLNKEDFEDLGLTKIGKKLILKILPESK